jgi:hypothetical protein
MSAIPLNKLLGTKPLTPRRPDGRFWYRGKQIKR